MLETNDVDERYWTEVVEFSFGLIDCLHEELIDPLGVERGRSHWQTIGVFSAHFGGYDD